MKEIPFYLRAHRYASRQAFRYLRSGWLGSLITLWVIAITLSLPWGLLLISRYAHTIFDQWNHQAQIVLYLKPNLSQKIIYDLKTKLETNSKISAVNYISPEMGLARLERREGFKEAIAQLDENPLPPVLEIEPNSNLSPQEIEVLAEQLRQIPVIDQDQLNINSVKQLYTVLTIAKRFIATLAILLSAAVMLIVGNTLRLIILERTEEIHVMKLVGASQAYTRRPYLYIGLILGIFGGVLAWSLTFLFFSYLDFSLKQLNHFNIESVPALQANFFESFLFLSSCAFLGWFAAMVASQRYLKQ
ncbi:MAG: hypothetical protein ACD_44C00453G0009 [uncultured bacterium]|nr:MAG: hypothetical protein ACD_44C00453G0009 [uncultured bacterium]OGT16658.1 MAG: hypothetical protein A3B69_02615 [Gammaproteobacteria bacterium RIFCSPHIGHO2_02_FULL_38_33]OGT23123.1 MAG: hypothetical protein A2W47_04220 [Gammaproteobacteria bacterium RIFCSPHIGHO2_12_38_15]OGT67503.1 MAG: hypothetical protein A3I12_04890 [Gammaproteobacteria bacterium RIFCSPLOWO2_02_FULL_38_11]OGT77626.1 MAG: hypothetical protein A3G71_01900 [Gammaproteobacteria bacterium RIFCSPLOWO2_12_FULL_38_14]